MPTAPTRGIRDGTAVEALQRCVGDVDHFAEKAWGQRVVVHGPSPDGFGDLLSLDDVDRLISGHGLRTPAFRMVRDGQSLPESHYTRSARLGGRPMTGIADPARVFAAFDEGATLVLQGLQRYWPPLTRLCRDLELALGHQCQVNAYVTPPGSQGFHEHSDTHDVFVLQTFGRKVWRIRPAPGEEPAEAGEGAAREVELEPGVAVYMPTGTKHAAHTQHTVSGHLTVGIHPTRWRDVVEQAVSRALDDPALDAPLPVGFHRDPETLAAQITDHLHRVRSGLDEVDGRDVAAGVADRFFTRRQSVLRGGLTDRVRLHSLTDDGLLHRRPGAVCEIRADDDGPLRVLLGDRELVVPRWVEPAIQAVAARDTFAVRDLAPYLDHASRLVLVRRLVREGMLEVARA